ncbi:MAG: thioredoxin domain-containing protein [Acidobacteriota bacterium]|nr:thioredoxin domain-containing protein [Acidobacteriota bacterium]MDQ7088894.1 thioredoxin domain-containing protein [Acidobacteriota bacterium]
MTRFRTWLPLSLILVVLCPAALPVGAGQPEVLARVGGQEITKTQVLEAAASQLAELRQKEYDILKGALDQVIDEMLLNEAATKKGQTLEEFINAEIESKAGQPTDQEIQDFYNKYKSRLGGKTLEQARPQIVQRLGLMKKQELFNEIISRLRKAAEVAVFLDPPRVKVAEAGNPAWGPKDAPVTIIEFSDFECPYCARAEKTIDQIKEKYAGKVRIVFRDFPLSFHRHAQKAHEAAACAGDQDKYWEMHKLLFDNQKALAPEQLVSYASQIGLDMDKFKACLDSGSKAEEIAADQKAGAAAGVSGTPAFFINGRFLSGAQPFEAFAQIIDEELAR